MAQFKGGVNAMLHSGALAALKSFLALPIGPSAWIESLATVYRAQSVPSEIRQEIIASMYTCDKKPLPICFSPSLLTPKVVVADENYGHQDKVRVLLHLCKEEPLRYDKSSPP